jgi:hypothetical protein
MSKNSMKPLRSINVGYKRQLYNTDLYALHSPIFNYKLYRWGCGSLLVHGLFYRQRNFTIYLSLNNQIKLPVDILAQLPLHLTLDIRNPIEVPLDYLGNNYNVEYSNNEGTRWSKRFEYYIFKPWWRVKTLAYLGIVSGLSYWLWKRINTHYIPNDNELTKNYQLTRQKLFNAIRFC